MDSPSPYLPAPTSHPRSQQKKVTRQPLYIRTDDPGADRSSGVGGRSDTEGEDVETPVFFSPAPTSASSPFHGAVFQFYPPPPPIPGSYQGSSYPGLSHPGSSHPGSSSLSPLDRSQRSSLSEYRGQIPMSPLAQSSEHAAKKTQQLTPSHSHRRRSSPVKSPSSKSPTTQSKSPTRPLRGVAPTAQSYSASQSAYFATRSLDRGRHGEDLSEAEQLYHQSEAAALESQRDISYRSPGDISSHYRHPSFPPSLSPGDHSSSVFLIDFKYM